MENHIQELEHDETELATKDARIRDLEGHIQVVESQFDLLRTENDDAEELFQSRLRAENDDAEQQFESRLEEEMNVTQQEIDRANELEGQVKSLKFALKHAKSESETLREELGREKDLRDALDRDLEAMNIESEETVELWQGTFRFAPLSVFMVLTVPFS
jgi:chromosome segregation ATPase